MKKTRIVAASRLLTVAFYAVGAAVGVHAFAADAPASSSAAADLRQDRLKAWRAARFGMFLHWGIYAIPADGEWYMNNHSVPVAEYEKLAQQFNPVKFNADTWAQIAHDSGQRYLIITARHNDGFCMFKTAADPYNVVDATPWKRDPTVELSHACKKHGLLFGCYFSLTDWHSAHQSIARADPAHPQYHPTHFDSAEQKAAYLNEVKAELKDLISQSHPDLIWFDGGDVKGWSAEDGAAIRAFIQSLDPSIITNDRAGGESDFIEAEGGIPSEPQTRPWEFVATINGSWGFTAKDQAFRSPNDLVRTLVDVASKGGNFLLNVGPDSQGQIPEAATSQLEGVGDWLTANGEAIYGAGASPFHQQFDWARCTQRPGKLYFSLLQYSAGARISAPISNPVTKAYYLDDPYHPLTVQSSEDGANIQMRQITPDPMVPVLVLEIKGEPAPVEKSVKQAADGSITLLPGTAELNERHLTLENDPPNIGGWNVQSAFPQWHVNVKTPGKFSMEVLYGLHPPGEGTQVVFFVGDQQMPMTLSQTGGWQTYQVLKLPDAIIAKPGPLTILIKDKTMPGGGVMNIRWIKLKPIASP